MTLKYKSEEHERLLSNCPTALTQLMEAIDYASSANVDLQILTLLLWTLQNLICSTSFVFDSKHQFQRTLLTILATHFIEDTAKSLKKAELFSELLWHVANTV